MLEICVTISPGELTPDQLNGWVNMCSALAISVEGHTKSNEQSWAAISVVTYHSYSNAILKRKGV